MDQVHVVWDDDFTAYDFGPHHPMSPARLELTTHLCRDLGLFAAAGVRVVGADPADDATLTLAHDPAYVAAVRRASATGFPDLAHGLGSDDVPVFTGMHEASARIVAGSVGLARAVWAGETAHGVNYCGGLHHAMRSLASGFCVYNDVVAAIAALLQAGADKVAYVDVDVHHGDGVQAAFWDDPRVITISLHESGRMLFPGTGFADEIGGMSAQGDAVNVALPPGTGDAGWLRAFHAVVPPLVRAFTPDVLVSQHGCDSHFLDPLAHLALSLDAQRASYSALHDLAHAVCDGRWVATGGGGYEVVEVVPRAWAHLVGIAAHAPVAPATAVPQAFREFVTSRMGGQAPARMTDGRDVWWQGWEVGFDPHDATDRAIMATRKAVFPLHGLDPYFD